jgi:glutathione S-transferase
MITLYGITRSRASRCLWMLEELGVPYERELVNFGEGGTRSPAYLAVNPNGKLPALRDDGVTLFESMAINLYLAEKYGPALWPKTVEDRGLAYQWSVWAMTELEAAALTLLRQRALLAEGERSEEAARGAEESLRKPFGVLEGKLDGRPFLLGADFTVADLNVSAVASWARRGKMPLDEYPRAKDWLERCLERPAYKKMMKL